MIDAKQIAAVMGGEARGNQVSFPTPGHSSKDRGVSVTVDPTAPDGFLVNVHNGGDALAIKAEIMERLGLSREQRGGTWRTTGTYVFTDEEGRPLYRTQRKEKPGEPKRFEAQRADGDGWANGLKDVRRVPYRLQELLMTKPGEPILFAEGERKADRLAEMGFVATAVAFGCKGWRAEYAEHFRGRSVAILPDNDDPGRAFALQVQAAIEAIGERAVIVDLPGLPRAGDIMDWNGSADELRALIEAKLNQPPKLLPLIDLQRWAKEDAPLRVFAWGDWIPLRQTTMLTGRGGVGKSLFEQMLCTCVALGLPLLGMKTRQANALYLTAEDDEDELWRRQSAICASLGVPLRGIIGRLHLVSLTGHQDTALATFDETHRLQVTDRWREVEATAEAHEIGFAAFDNATDMMAGDHNDIHEVAEFVNMLTGFAIRRDGVSMILHHPNKAGDDWLGSVAWHNKVRSRLIVKDGAEGDTDARQILNPKANYGASGGRIDFRWFKGAFVRDEDLPPNMATEIAANVKANHDNDVFLECLALRTEQQRRVSDASGKAYAPAVFAEMAESKGIGKRRLEQAMERLFRIGQIESGYLWRFDGKDRFGLRLVDANAPANGPPTRSANGRQAETPTDANTHLGTTYHKGAGAEAAAPLPSSGGEE